MFFQPTRCHFFRLRRCNFHLLRYFFALFDIFIIEIPFFKSKEFLFLVLFRVQFSPRPNYFSSDFHAYLHPDPLSHYSMLVFFGIIIYQLVPNNCHLYHSLSSYLPQRIRHPFAYLYHQSFSCQFYLYNIHITYIVIR